MTVCVGMRLGVRVGPVWLSGGGRRYRRRSGGGGWIGGWVALAFVVVAAAVYWWVTLIVVGAVVLPVGLYAVIRHIADRGKYPDCGRVWRANPGVRRSARSPDESSYQGETPEQRARRETASADGSYREKSPYGPGMLSDLHDGLACPVCGIGDRDPTAGPGCIIS